MKLRSLNQRGDTIIEVMLAMALLSLFLYISWAITNRATQMSLNARTRVVMVNALKEQAEIIKAKTIQSGTSVILSGTSQTLSPADDPCNDALMDQANATIANSFHYSYNSSTQSVTKISNYKKVNNNNSSRIWIQQKQETSNEYTDFYVRGCWETVGGAQKLDNSNFILRLNN